MKLSWHLLIAGIGVKKRITKTVSCCLTIDEGILSRSAFQL